MQLPSNNESGYLERIHELEVEIAILKEHHISADTARHIQAIEYERRLAELNGAHELATRALSTYVSFVKYDADISNIEDRLDKIEREQSKRSGQYAAIGIAVTIGLVVLTIIVNVFLRFSIKV